MNISLTNTVTQSDPDAEPIESTIEEHRKIMEHAGYNLTGNTILINQPDAEGNDYPGSYQVWLETTNLTWVYVDPEGRAIEADNPIGGDQE